MPYVRFYGEALEEVLNVEFFLFRRIERRALLDRKARDYERYPEEQTESEHYYEVERGVRHRRVFARDHAPEQRRYQIEDACGDYVEQQFPGIGSVALSVIHRNVRAHRHIRHLGQRGDRAVDDIRKDHPHDLGTCAEILYRSEQYRKPERYQNAAYYHIRLSSSQFGPTRIVGNDAHRRVDYRVPYLGHHYDGTGDPGVDADDIGEECEQNDGDECRLAAPEQVGGSVDYLLFERYDVFGSASVLDGGVLFLPLFFEKTHLCVAPRQSL